MTAVLLFHAGFNFFNENALKGGFLGVDVFFVLSGYLISSIIIADFEKGTFSFRDFYARRIRRIIPLLVVVMACTLPLAWIYMLPNAMVEYSYSALSALLFSSNFWFWLEDSYWAEPSALKPLLHTWSLSVEEQFYVLFPALLVVLLRFARRHALLIIASIGLCSLIAAEISLAGQRDASFYLLPTRVWELFSGTMLALLQAIRGRKARPLFRLTLPTLGAAMVGASFFLFDEQTRHPSILTAIPIAGTMMIVWFSGGKDVLTKLLTLGPVVWLGKISYGLYLWHFPVFAFGLMIAPEPTRYDKALWIMFSVGMAAATFYSIETPARRSPRVRTVLVLIVTGVALLATLYASIVINKGFASRMPAILAEDFDQEPWKNMTNDQGQYCFADYGKRAFCEFGTGNPRGEVVLLGDSTLEAISAAIVPLLLDNGYSVVTMNGSGCYYLPGFDLVGPGDVDQRPGIDQCDAEFQQKRQDRLRRSPGSIVILGGIFHRYMDGTLKQFLNSAEPELSVREGYLRAVNDLLAAGHIVVQLAPFPFFQKDPASQLRTALASISDLNLTNKDDIEALSLNTGTMESGVFEASIADASVLFASVDNANMHVIYPHKLFCNSYLTGQCVSNDGKNLFFVDAAHPARAGAALIAEFIESEIQQIGSEY